MTRRALNAAKSHKPYDCPKCGLTLKNQCALGNRVKHQKCCTEEERFWFKVNKTEGCWLWTGFLNHDGYGRVAPRRGVHTGMRAHRYAWQLVNGTIPADKELMHTCDTRACVRPDHLRLGTHDDNMADCHAKNRHVYGTAMYNAILDEHKVREVRRLRAEEGLSYYKIGKRFGVTYSTARYICARKTWKHVI